MANMAHVPDSVDHALSNPFEAAQAHRVLDDAATRTQAGSPANVPRRKSWKPILGLVLVALATAVLVVVIGTMGGFGQK